MVSDSENKIYTGLTDLENEVITLRDGDLVVNKRKTLAHVGGKVCDQHFVARVADPERHTKPGLLQQIPCCQQCCQKKSDAPARAWPKWAVSKP